jgi:hypothetical protein
VIARHRVKVPVRPLLLACTACAVLATPARADMVSREADVTNLRLGQHVLVDDGTCPTGQIKDITGVKLSPSGVLRTRKCVDRKTARR